MGVQRQPEPNSKFKDSMRYHSKILSQKHPRGQNRREGKEEGEMEGDIKEKAGEEGGSGLEIESYPFFSSHLCLENRGETLPSLSLCTRSENASCPCLRMPVTLFFQRTTGRHQAKQNKTKPPTGCGIQPLCLGRSLRTSMYFLNLFFVSLVLRRTGVIKHRWRRADNVVVVRRRHHTTLYVCRNLGRPQDLK